MARAIPFIVASALQLSSYHLAAAAFPRRGSAQAREWLSQIWIAAKRTLPFKQQVRWVLEQLLDAHQEAHSLAAVDDAVVVGERDIHHRPDDDFFVPHDRAPLDCMHAQNADLGRVEDRRRHQRAVNTAIGDRESAAGQLRQRQRAVLGPGRQIDDRFLDVGKGLLVGVARTTGTTSPSSTPTAMPMS